ncbi:Ferredoxin--NAD(P)(+) reductase fdr [Jannaschia seosinensis]|uniref:Ferredoxin--NAD(P)(+) reductase fdr n=1 Tax=Jannaschia seosinensis TaxID=313367 RepID=A0A0M7B5H6_9RHOB|nr:FAD-dependent oxidoreductase [Jannaschia seosinensis]CUH23731.1 Ferredoxin--NAD(P)(+) reductase fdr [Jannaschia seosinensis]
MPQYDVAALSDIPEATPHAAQAGERTILLIRRGGDVTALTHECPHLGLPLSKGALDGDRVICAFHHACFDTATGRQMQPPGHGDLQRFDVEIRDGRVLVDLPDDAPAHVVPDHTRQKIDTRRVVLIGAGAAAEACALRLREAGFEGAVEMISPEERAPYDRTMLSKGVLARGTDPASLTTTDADGLAARDITPIKGTVAAVEPGRVTLADGTIRPYDALLVAPGGAPNRPDLPGGDLPGVHLLRSAASAAGLSAAADAAKRAVLIGGGFIGMEAALSLTKRGLDVTLIVQEDLPLSKVVGERVARAILAEHKAAGVDIRTGASVEAFTGEGHVAAVRLKDGTEIETDLVLLAIGVTPVTGDIAGLAAGEDGGVAVGPDLGVPGLDSVFVAGDCARAPTPFGPARIEHWRVARQHGIRAADAMMDHLGIARPEPAEVEPDIPFFWTALARQYRYLGHAEGWDDVLFDGDPAEGPFLARYVKDGRVMAAVTAGKDHDLARLHHQMIAAGGPVPA